MLLWLPAETLLEKKATRRPAIYKNSVKASPKPIDKPTKLIGRESERPGTLKCR